MMTIAAATAEMAFTMAIELKSDRRFDCIECTLYFFPFHFYHCLIRMFVHFILRALVHSNELCELIFHGGMVGWLAGEPCGLAREQVSVLNVNCQ